MQHPRLSPLWRHNPSLLADGCLARPTTTASRPASRTRWATSCVRAWPSWTLTQTTTSALRSYELTQPRCYLSTLCCPLHFTADCPLGEALQCFADVRAASSTVMINSCLPVLDKCLPVFFQPPVRQWLTSNSTQATAFIFAFINLEINAVKQVWRGARGLLGNVLPFLS